MKIILMLISFLLLISDFGYAATRKIYINFDNKPPIDPTTGRITPNTGPPEGKINVLYWGGTGYPAVLGKKSQYITGRGNTGYALSGIIPAGSDVGTWPYLEWDVYENVSWSSEIYVSFWMKYVNFKVIKAYKPYENIKLFYWHFGGYTMGEIALGNPPEGSPPRYSEYTRSWRDEKSLNAGTLIDASYHTYEDTDGNWHHYEFHLNRAAGRAKWWIDGKLIKDWNPGYPHLGASPYYIQWIHIAGSLIGTGPNSNGTRAFDDIEVWDGMPGTTSSISPPPSTSPMAPAPPMKLIIQ